MGCVYYITVDSPPFSFDCTHTHKHAHKHTHMHTCTHSHTHILPHTQGKTTLNNALQLHLRRLNKTLEYDIIRTTHPVTRQPIFRCLVDVPYPEPFTAVGEGLTKKEAEKRGGSAACLKLLVSGWCVLVVDIRTEPCLVCVHVIKFHSQSISRKFGNEVVYVALLYFVPY